MVSYGLCPEPNPSFEAKFLLLFKTDTILILLLLKTVKSWTYNETAEFPVFVDFDANGFFTEGTEAPSIVELLTAMQELNYMTYIGK